jgi:hypothetical protein
MISNGPYSGVRQLHTHCCPGATSKVAQSHGHDVMRCWRRTMCSHRNTKRTMRLCVSGPKFELAIMRKRFTCANSRSIRFGMQRDFNLEWLPTPPAARLTMGPQAHSLTIPLARARPNKPATANRVVVRAARVVNVPQQRRVGRHAVSGQPSAVPHVAAQRYHPRRRMTST